MSSLDYSERMALRTAATLAQAQCAYDDRAEPEDNDDAVIYEQIRLAVEFIGRAERALQAGDRDAATDLLGCAAYELREVATGEFA